MDFKETLRSTGVDLAEEFTKNGHDLQFDFEAGIFGNVFGAGEFQNYIGKFLKWFFLHLQLNMDFLYTHRGISL